MNTPKGEHAPVSQDVSWLLLLAIAAVVISSLCLLRYTTLYTEGEVTQGVFTLLIGLVAASVLTGLRNRRVAVWCVTLLGGALLIWQSFQIRKWAVIHEDIVALVRFVEDAKSKTGNYPSNLEGYVFQNPEIRSHIYDFQSDETNGFRITYFMNNPGISYWYSSQTGFGYYPD